VWVVVAVGVGWFFSLASVVLCGLGRALPFDYVDCAVLLLGLARPGDYSEKSSTYFLGYQSGHVV
jgi:hypothetical protein